MPRKTGGIIIIGVAGSGKTSVGTLLAKELGWTFHDADLFHPPANREKMTRGLPLTDEDRKPWLETLATLVARHVEREEPMVLACSALKRAYRRILAKDSVILFVYLKSSPETASSRLHKRTGHFFHADLLESQFRTLEEPTEEEGGCITVESAAPKEAILRTIIEELSCRNHLSD
ncbi:MAG: gluconokinase [Simkaniaceae bacterium]|nr:gluconokinase [Simkaniaceae bacterium]